jgi:plasmid stability protein
MTQLIVMGLAPETIAKLQIQAHQHGRSLDEEVKTILELATRSVDIDAATIQAVKETDQQQRLAWAKTRFGFTDAAEAVTLVPAHPCFEEITPEQQKQTVQTAIARLQAIRQRTSLGGTSLRELRGDSARTSLGNDR